MVRDRLRAIVAEYEPVVAYLGLPRHLKGAEGESAAKARGQARWLASGVPRLEVRLVDERMTTVSATRQLREAGRSARSQRGVIDQAAAVAILNHALDTERLTGARAGSGSTEGNHVMTEPRRRRRSPARPRDRRSGTRTRCATA